MLNLTLTVISILCLIPLFISAAALLIYVMLTKTLLRMDSLISADLQLAGNYYTYGSMAQHLGKFS